MGSLIRLLLLALASLQIGATVLPRQGYGCSKVTQRKEWKNMADSDKRAYIAANQCIMRTPQKLNKMPGAKTRWDEFVSLHQIHALQIHSTGTFLPYHRYFLNIHQALLAECGYTGALPWWDEAKDAGAFSKASVFNTTLGFGGIGNGASLCVGGPYANYTVNIGQGFKTEPRCINRKITDSFSAQVGPTYVEDAKKGLNYTSAWVDMYLGPHLWGHIGLAMMNGDSITSSGDPLFMLHHAFIDKLWWDWQSKDIANRLTDMGGPNAQDPAVGFIEFGGGTEEQSKMWGKPTAEMLAITPDPAAGDNGNITTLNHVLSSLGIIPDAKIADVMDIKGGYLCYEYV